MNSRRKLSEESFLSYQVIFILNFLFVVLLMKIASWKMSGLKSDPQFLRFLFATPLLSYTAFRHRIQHPSPLWFILLKFFMTSVFMGFMILIAHKLNARPHFSDVLLLSPLIYLLTEWMGVFAQLLFYPVTALSPLHNHPLSSHTLGEFWGRRWNIWVQDWLRDIARPHRRTRVKKLLITFFISGLFHEVMVNLPYLLKYGKLTFGNMIIYFLLQALGLWVDKKYLHRAPSKLRRIFLWLVVAIPSPLFLNKPLLLFFGIN